MLGVGLSIPAVAVRRRGLLILEQETKDLLDRMEVTPGPKRQALINTPIKALVEEEIWPKIDCLYPTAAHTAQAGRLNWIEDAYNLTPINSPTHIVDRGYQGDAATALLSTGFNPVTAGGNFALNDAYIAVWSLTDIASNTRDIGNGFAFIVTRNNTSDITYTRLNDGSTGSFANDNSIGYFSLSRDNGASYRCNRNGDLVATAKIASTTVGNFAFSLLGDSVVSSYSPRLLSLAVIGRALTVEEDAIVRSVFHDYLQAVGAVA